MFSKMFYYKNLLPQHIFATISTFNFSIIEDSVIWLGVIDGDTFSFHQSNLVAPNPFYGWCWLASNINGPCESSARLQSDWAHHLAVDTWFH